MRAAAWHCIRDWDVIHAWCVDLLPALSALESPPCWCRFRLPSLISLAVYGSFVKNSQGQIQPVQLDARISLQLTTQAMCTALLALCVLLLLAFTLQTLANGLVMVQLDVCSMHRRISTFPSMTLRVGKDGTCLVTSMFMVGSSGSSCAVSTADEAVQFSFPCTPKAANDTRKTVGPALNIWAMVPALSAAPAAATILEAGSPQQDPPASRTCNFTTMNPVIYYHKTPPLYLYGYSLSGVACQRVLPGGAAMQATDGLVGHASQYGLWLLPSLPPPPKEFSTAPQACHIVMTVLNKSYISTSTYPCELKPQPAEQLGKGCCYDPPRKFSRLML